MVGRPGADILIPALPGVKEGAVVPLPANRGPMRFYGFCAACAWIWRPGRTLLIERPEYPEMPAAAEYPLYIEMKNSKALILKRLSIRTRQDP